MDSGATLLITPGYLFPFGSIVNQGAITVGQGDGLIFQQSTGPVTISIFINGHLFGKVKYGDAGRKQFEKPVPVAFLNSKAVNFAALEIDKVWVSKTDGAVLGFILTSAGFSE
jgi:hypothetical protein